MKMAHHIVYVVNQKLWKLITWHLLADSPTLTSIPGNFCLIISVLIMKWQQGAMCTVFGFKGLQSLYQPFTSWQGEGIIHEFQNLVKNGIHFVIYLVIRRLYISSTYFHETYQLWIVLCLQMIQSVSLFHYISLKFYAWFWSLKLLKMFFLKFL